MPDTKIQLPVEKSGEIAFNYMEERIKELEHERIKELEHERIKELEAYLQATGLRDYQLSAEENRVLAEFNDLIENPHTHTHRLMKFKMGDIFEFKAIKQARSQKEIPTDNSKNGVPYVVQSLFNNMFSRNVNRDWLIEHNEAPIAGNRIVLGVTLPAVSYWEKEFGASQVITATSSWMNRKTGLFAATAISKLMVLFSYSQKPGIEIYKNLEITLPSIKESSNPDFEFMETFIRAVEKLAIADVVKWLDAQIEATKQVVSRG